MRDYAGCSIDAGSTNTPRPTDLGWPFFLPAPRVLARICGGGLRVNPFHVASFAASLASLFSTFRPVPVEDSWGLSLP